MKNRLLFLMLLLLLCTCTHRNDVVIKGHIEEGYGRTIYLSLVTTDGIRMLDSASLSRGFFSFVIKDEQLSLTVPKGNPAFYQLALSDDNAMTTVAQAGQTIEIKANAKSLVKTYHVSGSADALLMWQLDSALACFVSATDTLLWVYETNMDNDSIRADVEKRYNALADNHTLYLRQFVKENAQSMSAIIAFYQVYNNRKFLDEKTDADVFSLLVDALTKKYPTNEYISYLQARR